MAEQMGSFEASVLSRSASVTWSLRASPGTIAKARDVAARCGLPVSERRDTTEGIVVVVENAGAYALLDDHRFVSHPGMGLLRVKRIAEGDRFDQLLKATGVKEGDHILDTTFGFGQDSLVLAAAVGKRGQVTAIEASSVLTALALAGMPHWPAPADDISARINLMQGDHATFLAQAPDHSFDVVVFDPMFRHPKAAAPGFDLLRTIGNTTPLSIDTLQQARRVARRLVVVKDAWPGRELERLELEKIGVRPFRTTAFLFGVIPAL